MKDIILAQHEQITHAQEVNQQVKVNGEFDSIVLAGMGGSGHPGDLINALGLSTKPLYVHRNYDLPLPYLNHLGLTQPLIIVSSYSGNTEESLTAYQAAKQHGLTLLVSSAGGQLAQLAKADTVPYCHIDYPGMQPRHTLLAATVGIITALKNSGLAEDITADLYRTAKVLKKKTPLLDAVGQQVASRIKGRIPVFISTDNLGFAAKNFKIQTNENAKYPAFWNTFPELNHNELVGFSKLKESSNPNQFIAIMLHDEDDHPQNKARMAVTAELYEEWGVAVDHFTATGETKLEKLFHTIMLGLWTTMHLAIAYNIDPVPVEGVEGFKARLKEIAGDNK